MYRALYYGKIETQTYYIYIYIYIYVYILILLVYLQKKTQYKQESKIKVCLIYKNLYQSIYNLQ